MRQRWIGVASVCILLVFASCAVGFYFIAVRPWGEPTPPPITAPNITPEMRRDAEQWFNIKFPNSAALLVYAPTEGKDFNLDVKLTMPASDLSRLLTQATLAHAKWTSLPPPDYTMGPEIPQWKPNLVAMFRKTEVAVPNGYLDVLVDDTSPSIKTVYLSYWEP
jgi:hypothetical protein